MCWNDEGQTQGYTPEDFYKDMQEAEAEAKKNPSCATCRFCYREYGNYECKYDAFDYDKDIDEQHCELWSFGC